MEAKLILTLKNGSILRVVVSYFKVDKDTKKVEFVNSISGQSKEFWISQVESYTLAFNIDI